VYDSSVIVEFLDALARILPPQQVRGIVSIGCGRDHDR
jgi:hypothetical protein